MPKTLPAPLMERLTKVAEAEGQTPADFVGVLLDDYLKAREQEGRWQHLASDGNRRAQARGITEDDVADIVHDYLREKRQRGP